MHCGLSYITHTAFRHYLYTTKSNQMRVGLTTGDPNGIGVETILKTFQDDRMFNSITPILYASEKLVEYNMKVLEIENLNVNVIDSADKAKKGKLNIVKACSEEFSVTEGELSSDAGAYSFSSLKTAVEDLASTKFDVLVTAPINKDAKEQINNSNDDVKSLGNESWNSSPLVPEVDEIPF